MTFRGLIPPRQNPELFTECLDSGYETEKTISQNDTPGSCCAEQKADKSISTQSAVT